MKRTIADAKRINRENGNHFFDDDAMKFFSSKVETDILGPNDDLFITSERGPGQSTKRYTIRRIDWTNGRIETVGEHQQFTLRAEARNYARNPERGSINAVL